MAYENDHYRALKSKISNYETAKRYIDLARTFRSMKYAERLDFSCRTKIHSDELTAALSQSMKDEVLEFAGQKCEDLAVKLLQNPAEDFDIRKACSE